MWIILIIILAINSMWLLKLNKDLANRKEYLIRQEEDNNSRLQKLMMDKENKVIVFRLATSNINENTLRQLSDNVKGLKEDGYKILVIDSTFDFSEINIPEEEVEKLKKILEDKNKED